MAVAVRGSSWSPFATLFRQFDAALVPAYAARPVAFAPAADVTKDGNDVVVTLALPGVDVAKDVEVVVTEGKLAISGKRAEQTESTAHGVLRREIHRGEFRREFTIPRDVTADRVEADYDKGLLQVRVREVVRQTPEPAKVQIRDTAAVAAVAAAETE